MAPGHEAFSHASCRGASISHVVGPSRSCGELGRMRYGAPFRSQIVFYGIKLGCALFVRVETRILGWIPLLSLCMIPVGDTPSP